MDYKNIFIFTAMIKIGHLLPFFYFKLSITSNLIDFFIKITNMNEAIELEK